GPANSEIPPARLRRRARGPRVPARGAALAQREPAARGARGHALGPGEAGPLGPRVAARGNGGLRAGAAADGGTGVERRAVDDVGALPVDRGRGGARG